MKTKLESRPIARWQFAALSLAAAFAVAPAIAQTPKPFIITAHSENIVSDIPGVAHNTDPNLVNPWGITPDPEDIGRKIDVSDDGSGLVSHYRPDGYYVSGSNAATVPQATITSGTLGTPTGIVLDRMSFLKSGSDDFLITNGTASGPSHYLVATQDGVIAGYSKDVDPTAFILKVDGTSATTDKAGYTGLALSFISGTGASLYHTLYAADFRNGTVDVFDNTFTAIPPAVATGSNNFIDPLLPDAPNGDSWSPFNVKHIAFYSNKPGKKPVLTRRILVAFALHSGTAPMNDIPGQGNGAVAIFKPDGTFIRELVPAGGLLNSPWGIAIAHDATPEYRTPIAVLIGNHGDGKVNVYTYDSSDDNGIYLGTLTTNLGEPLVFDGLWALHFGLAPAKTITDILEDLDEVSSDDPTTLYFSAGILGEQDGLLGRIVPD